MLLQLLVTSVVMLALMGVYYLITYGLRRVSPGMREDYDPLEDRWGCPACEDESCDILHS